MNLYIKEHREGAANRLDNQIPGVLTFDDDEEDLEGNQILVLERFIQLETREFARSLDERF